MTPKEKAKELVDKMLDKLYNGGSLSFKHILQRYAKQCALIAVDEVLSTGCWVSKECAEKEGFEPECTEEYWEKVKLEIEKL